jgi:hypothetical protein
MSDNDHLIYQIINTKVIDFAELVIELFENCNMRCAFCPQNHESLDQLSREEILYKTNYIIDWINKNNKSRYFKIHMMGGEVFQDKFMLNGYTEIYQEFMDIVKAGIIDKQKQIHFNFVTNLVFDETDIVLDFLRRNDLKVSTSYDSTGRFTKQEFKTYKRNIEIFKNYITMVSCVMSAPNMLKIVEGKDEYFDYLYNNFTIDWDSLWPTQTDNINRFLMPKESEAFEFYKVLVDKYPNCLNVEHFVTDKPQMKMTCTRGNNTTLRHNNKVPQGCSGSAYVVDRKTSDDDVSEVMTNFFEKYDCFTCEFFSRCPFTCFVKADYKYIEDDLDDCVFRKTFKYVSQRDEQ